MYKYSSQTKKSQINSDKLFPKKIKMKFTVLFVMISVLAAVSRTECRNNQSDTEDVCVNETICFNKHRMPMRIKSKQLSLFINTECKCASKIYRNKCGNGLCAVDRNACNETSLASLKRNEAISLGIKKCPND